MELPKKKLIILGVLATLAIVLFPLSFLKINTRINTKINNTPPPIPSFQNQTLPPVPKVTFACPVPKELCSEGKEIINGGVFLGVGYTLPRGTKIISSMPGRTFFTAAEDKAHSIITHSKMVQTGRDFQKGYVLIYEFFTPQASGSAVNKDIARGENIGTIGFGTFPKNPPYNGINFMLSVLKDGKPFDFKASDLLPI